MYPWGGGGYPMPGTAFCWYLGPPVKLDVSGAGHGQRLFVPRAAPIPFTEGLGCMRRLARRGMCEFLMVPLSTLWTYQVV